MIEVSENFRKDDKIEKVERDFKHEAESMIRSFQQSMKNLDGISMSGEEKREAQRQMVEGFKQNLREVMDQAGEGAQMDALVAFVMGNIGEVVPGMPVESTGDSL